tara:strand:+ start:143 stop:466 length:324 start_codon:yes stop_codon:yes gene_type:complete
MANAPRFKVYDADGQYIGCAKGADEAVVLARYKGVGAEVRDGHGTRDTVYAVGRQSFTNVHAAAADIYVAIDKRAKARAMELEVERKRLASQSDIRQAFRLYKGKKR